MVVLGGGAVSYERGTPASDPYTFHAWLCAGPHCYLKLTEVPRLLLDVPTLDFCSGEQRSQPRSNGNVHEHVAAHVLTLVHLWGGGPHVLTVVFFLFFFHTS